MKSGITIDSLLKKRDRLNMRLAEIWQEVAYLQLDIKKTDVFEERQPILSRISDLRSDKYRLVSPLPITLSIENDIYAVTSYDLNMFGYGESDDEAIQDLCDAIVEYYEELEDNQNRLGKIPTQHKHFLDQIIQKCN
jgi:hypothetical protein